MSEVKMPNDPNTTSNDTGDKESSDKRFSKVTSGKVNAKKKSELRKFADIFVPGDIQKVKHSIIYDMIIPIVRDSIVSIINNSVNMLFYDGAQNSAPRTNFSSTASWNNPGASRQWGGSRYWSSSNSQQYQPSYSNAPADYRDVIFSSRRDAEEVLEAMCTAISDYGKVTVADYYDLAGITSEYTDNKYGWYDLRGIGIRAVNGGFVIVLPKAVALK